MAAGSRRESCVDDGRRVVTVCVEPYATLTGTLHRSEFLCKLPTGTGAQMLHQRALERAQMDPASGSSLPTPESRPTTRTAYVYILPGTY